MGVTRFFSSVVLLVVPAGVVVQESVAGFVTRPGSASVDTQSLFLTFADLEGSCGKHPRLVIPTGVWAVLCSRARAE